MRTVELTRPTRWGRLSARRPAKRGRILSDGMDSPTLSHHHNGYQKALVAIANKRARMIWAKLARDQAQDSQAWQRHARAQPSAVTASPAVVVDMT